eukprot:13162000-Alexandrium_andersonii.AAC.1
MVQRRLARGQSGGGAVHHPHRLGHAIQRGPRKRCHIHMVAQLSRDGRDQAGLRHGSTAVAM